MSAVKIAAIVSIVAGILGLAYGKFSYTKESHEAKIGPLELSVKNKETVKRPALGWRGRDSGWRAPAADAQES